MTEQGIIPILSGPVGDGEEFTPVEQPIPFIEFYLGTTTGGYDCHVFRLSSEEIARLAYDNIRISGLEGITVHLARKNRELYVTYIPKTNDDGVIDSKDSQRKISIMFNTFMYILQIFEANARSE